MSDIQFAAPFYLLLLPLAALPLLRAKRQPTWSFSHIGLVWGKRRSWRLRLRPFLPWLRAIGLGCLVLALARPQWRQTESIQPSYDTVVVFALDVSNSMKFQDLQPDRLSFAKQLIADMVAERPSVPLGLVLIANQAYIQAPPTRDHAALLVALDQVAFAEQMGIADGSALGLGIAAAAGLLVDLPETNRAVILMTDGTSTDSAIDPLVATEAAVQSGIQIHAVGLGQSGQAPFPQHGLQGSYTVNWESQVDETVLQNIAKISDASYFRAADLDIQTDLPHLIAPESVNSFLSPAPQPRELFALWLGIGLALLLVEFMMRQSILRVLPEAE